VPDFSAEVSVVSTMLMCAFPGHSAKFLTIVMLLALFNRVVVHHGVDDFSWSAKVPDWRSYQPWWSCHGQRAQ
jgi:hypothetical protein